jgi:hypothetical protein
MRRTVIAGTVLVAGLLTPSHVAAGPAASAAQSAAQATAADAAPFIGDWTLDLQGQNGPGAFDLTVKVEKEKVVGEITGATMATQPIADVTKAGQSLVLSYTFNYEGNAVDAAVKLTPAPDGKTNAQIDFAGGAYVMSGTATKKEKVK